MKERINITNYEAWMLDYVEGNLSPERQSELLAFLDKHPEFKQELEEFEAVQLPAEEISFDDKLSLKRNDPLPPVNLENYEDYFIRSVENDLDKEEKILLKSFISRHPEKEKDLNLYKKTILPQEKVTFPNKEDLKKKDPKVIPIGRWVSVISATAAVGIILLLAPWQSDNNPSMSAAAEKKEPSVIEQASGHDADPSTEKMNEQPVAMEDIDREKEMEESIEDIGLGKKNHMPETEPGSASFTDRPVMAKVKSPEVELKIEKGELIRDTDTILYKAIPGTGLPDPQEDVAMVSDDEFLSPREYLGKRYKERVLQTNDNSTKVSRDDAVRGLLKGVESITGKRTDYVKEEEEEYVATRVKIGGFEFSRSKKR